MAQASITNRMGQAFGRLSEREKRLVLITAAVAIVLVVFLGVTLLDSALDKRQKRVAQRRDEIKQLDDLRGKYEDAVQAEKKSAARIRSNTSSLFSLMQKAASDVGLTLTDLNETRVPVKDNPDLSEVSVVLNLKEISVDKLTTLLEKIEGARNDGVVKVTKMKVKTRFDNPEMLEANLTVATWRSSSSAAAAPTPEATP
jgi:type II secretory pathway component PulM